MSERGERAKERSGVSLAWPAGEAAGERSGQAKERSGVSLVWSAGEAA